MAVSLTVPAVLADGKAGFANSLQGDRAQELAAVAAAYGRQQYRRVWELAWALEPQLSEAGRWLEVISTQKLALAAAVRLDDWLLQGHSHLALGRASAALGDARRSRQQLAEGACILRALGVRID
jgi:hypothetical protein